VRIGEVVSRGKRVSGKIGGMYIFIFNVYIKDQIKSPFFKPFYSEDVQMSYLFVHLYNCHVSLCTFVQMPFFLYIAQKLS